MTIPAVLAQAALCLGCGLGGSYAVFSFMGWQRRKRRAGWQIPEFSPLLAELRMEWERLSDADLERAGRNLNATKDSDKMLGVIHSLELRRTWALADVMRLRCQEAQIHARMRAESEEETQVLSEQAHRFDAMDDVLREIFWAQAKDDIGGKAWEARSLGIRSGWMLVSSPPKPPQVAEFFANLPGGGQ